VVIPLWIPWTLLLAVVLYAVLYRDAQLRWAPDPARWAVVAVVLVVTVSLTVDRLHVGEDELRDVVGQVAAEVDGTTGRLSTTRLDVLVERRLGREVEVEEVEDEDDEGPVQLVVRVGDDAAVCVGVYGQDGLDGPAITTTSVNDGAC
jgi:hypothetical protein